MKRITTFLVGVWMAVAAHAQNIDLQKQYDLNVWASEALSKSYTVQQAKAKYPAFFAWITWAGASEADAMTVNEVAAAWNDAVWSTDGYVEPYQQGAWPQNGCQSRANIDASGIYFAKVNIPLTVAHGQYIGGGTGNATELTTQHGGPGTTGGTQFMVDHDAWLSRIFPGRHILQSASWGDQSNMGYSESFVVRGFRLDGGMGNKPHDPSFESAGVAIWESGETSRVEYVFAHSFNTAGFLNYRGTPSIFIGCSAFTNRGYGFELREGALKTITLIAPSGDDNVPYSGGAGALIGGGAGSQGPGGGSVVIVGAKVEGSNLSGERISGTHRLLDLRGLVNVTILGGQVYAAARGDAAVKLDCEDYRGALDMRGIHLVGWANAVEFRSGGKSYTVPSAGDYAPVTIIANERGAVLNTRGRNDGGAVVDLSWLEQFEADNDTVVPPGPVDLCQWSCGEWSAWSPCDGGRQHRTRSCTSTGDCAGATAPALREDRDCEIPPSTCDRQGWTAKANVTWSGAKASYAIDGKPATAWTNGRAQRAGDYLQVDVGGCRITSVEFSTASAPWDYPGAYIIEVTANGRTWTQVASGKGSAQQQAYSANFPAREVRGVRLRLTASKPTYWLTIAEVTVK